jgi:hypothetical protein
MRQAWAAAHRAEPSLAVSRLSPLLAGVWVGIVLALQRPPQEGGLDGR